MKTMFGLRIPPKVARAGIFLLMLVLILGMVSCPLCPAPEPSVKQVTNWHELDAIRENLRGSYLLMNDLTATTAGYVNLAGSGANGGKGWVPIGTDEKPFTGTFDGGDNKISDLFIDRPEEENVGLFGYVREGVIKNVGVVGASVTGGAKVGALVGYNWNGTVESDASSPFSTHSTGKVAGKDDVGGLVGYSHWHGVVSLSESSAEVFSESWRAGGLVGHNWGKVLLSTYSGQVTGDRQVGGLVGLNKGHVINSDGQYTVTGNAFVGGVAGWNLRTGGLLNVKFNGDVNGVPLDGVSTALNKGTSGNPHISDAAPDGSYIGGVVGFNEGTVEDCSAAGRVTGISYVGGLVGGNDGTVDSCSSSGTVTGESAVGRLVGYNTQTGIVSKSISTSCVTDTPDCGDLVGRDDSVLVPLQYELTIYSTTGGSVPAPGEGTFKYDAGAVVYLAAEAEKGYQFVNWTGDVGTIANVNAGSTTITMNANYSITANFGNVSLSNDVAGQASAYTISFSIQQPLSDGDYIDIMFPAGTDLTGVTSVTITPDAAAEWWVIGEVIRIGVPGWVPPGAVTVVITPVKNPPPGSYTLWVGTSWETPVQSAPYKISVVTEITVSLSNDVAKHAFVDFYYRASPPVA